MIAYDYPLLGFFWTMLMLFLWLAWIILLVRVFADIFRNDRMGGWAKALWSIFVIVLPFLGVLVYLIAHGGDMTARDTEQARAEKEAFDAYVRTTAGPTGTSTADELAKLAGLRDHGVLSEDEFNAQKAKLLA